MLSRLPGQQTDPISICSLIAAVDCGTNVYICSQQSNRASLLFAKIPTSTGRSVNQPSPVDRVNNLDGLPDTGSLRITQTSCS
jgi:hypothetical protein